MQQGAFTLVLTVNVLFDFAAALVLCRCASRRLNERRHISVIGLCTAGLLTLALAVLRFPLLMALGFNFFGLMHALHLVLAAALPLAAAALLAFRVRGRLHMSASAVIMLVVAAIVPPALAAYAQLIETRRLQVETATLEVPPQRAGAAPLRIGILADLQTDRISEFEQRAVDALLEQSPDLILIPGDLFQGWPRQFQQTLPDFKALLQRLHAPAGVYFVEGDCERQPWLELLLEGSSIQTLRNQIIAIHLHDRTITIGGTQLDPHAAGTVSTIQRLDSQPGKDDLRILVSHRPDVLFHLPADSRIDLVVAGHTHGGQVQLPGFGPPITLSQVDRQICAGGLHEHRGNTIYVSRGLGHERGQAPRLRFMCPPEVTLLTIQPQNHQSFDR